MMTPEQRDAYLQRNREYKRRRKNHDAFSDGVQSAVSQINKITHGNMHAPALANRREKVGLLNMSTSDPSATSTSYTKLTSTAHKRMSTFLERGSEYKRMRVSNAAGCSTTLQETRDYVCASADIGQCKWTNTYMDMMSKLSGKRSSHEASCSSTHKDNGNLHDQYNPLKMQECAAVQDHEDHDSIIYVPNGAFPAIEDGLIEDEYEDDESCILSGQAST
ncbi:uncharacterized protein [Lolium perenne]|uniref:uncharacterized protein isoform X2 n=1 Tax=Lolium perenne TaxID=4522 RepID=UPI003A99C027